MTIAHVQSVRNSAAANSIGVAYPGNVTAGNLLVAAAVDDSTLDGSPTIADSQLNTWASASPRILNSFTGTVVQIFYAIANASSANTVTLTSYFGSGGIGLNLFEFSGQAVSPVDGSGATASGSTSNPSVSITTTVAHDLIVAICNSNTQRATVGTGYTSRVSGDTFYYELVEDKLDESSVGSVSVPFVNVASGWTIAAAAFKLASSSSRKQAVLMMGVGS